VRRSSPLSTFSMISTSPAKTFTTGMEQKPTKPNPPLSKANKSKEGVKNLNDKFNEGVEISDSTDGSDEIAQTPLSQAEDQDQFIDTGHINPLFRGPREFQKLVTRHYPKANFATKQLLARLLALEQDQDLGSKLLSNLQHTQPNCITKWSSADNKILHDLQIVFSTFSPAKVKIYHNQK
jgi:hypothetical protein